MNYWFFGPTDCIFACIYIMQMHISVADNFGMHALDSTVWYRFSSHFEWLVIKLLVIHFHVWQWSLFELQQEQFH